MRTAAEDMGTQVKVMEEVIDGLEEVRQEEFQHLKMKLIQRVLTIALTSTGDNFTIDNPREVSMLKNKIKAFCEEDKKDHIEFDEINFDKVVAKRRGTLTVTDIMDMFRNIDDKNEDNIFCNKKKKKKKVRPPLTRDEKTIQIGV